MAEIDNVRGKINLPGPEELAQDIELPQEEEAKGPIEINEMEDGGVEIDFDPIVPNHLPVHQVQPTQC